ncbi:uncharacterized protein LOC108292819 [Cebus imitator]|uniref:uncharacterized protein LOC108292819 n=1 Tax=Cebus imitator TaxID=2715852 RepID=UPI000809C89D|nr:uncharacterized protein LOC108292819 [Cebus imitator]XP_037589186.1 uncharacterized protein LOC108292819 [Cebus imitator]
MEMGPASQQAQEGVGTRPAPPPVPTLGAHSQCANPSCPLCLPRQRLGLRLPFALLRVRGPAAYTPVCLLRAQCQLCGHISPGAELWREDSRHPAQEGARATLTGLGRTGSNSLFLQYLGGRQLPTPCQQGWAPAAHLAPCCVAASLAWPRADLLSSVHASVHVLMHPVPAGSRLAPGPVHGDQTSCPALRSGCSRTPSQAVRAEELGPGLVRPRRTRWTGFQGPGSCVRSKKGPGCEFLTEGTFVPQVKGEGVRSRPAFAQSTGPVWLCRASSRPWAAGGGHSEAPLGQSLPHMGCPLWVASPGLPSGCAGPASAVRSPAGLLGAAGLPWPLGLPRPPCSWPQVKPLSSVGISTLTVT